jgi:predicted aldo/keto reductase-like oxidoreductase
MGDFQQLQRIATATAAYSCQGCSHICESRLDGPVRVADQLRYLMYEECYGEREAARKLYRGLKPAERAIDGVDFTRATRACPQGIDIAARLAAAREKLA